MLDMANKQIIPSVTGFAKSLAETTLKVKEACGDATVPAELLKAVTEKLTETKRAAEKLLEEESQASAMPRGKEQAFRYHDRVVTAMNELRRPADELEKMVDKTCWPFPTYADLIFEV